MALGLTLAIVGGALAVILGGIGSAIGVGLAGQASSGVMSEDPEKFGSLLLLVALPGTQGIYGFLSSFLVILKLGLTGGTLASPTVFQGWQILIACLPVGFTGLVSGIHQGKVCASGVYMVAKQPKDLMKPVIMAALVETYAVLGLLITILLLNGISL
ncbi:MAG: V-type ATP synthase subunit K [Candidatus Aminicenantes bacterium]|jgi:V/A-type H+-transporting ATPase subunit K|nr:V-type ATP synthase subunit K [Candidatus Aminicenantes bacterium]MDH5386219.1 V-type ATP synthase subunit K [Candidatus Aminicenantes bacterium]MDH5744541.1 V-type ATP synthase subunit K [Candidatus Aminicenantes bacterium]